VRLLFELSGEHPTLPAAEALACLSLQGGGTPLLQEPGLLVAEAQAVDLSLLASRFGLTHRIDEALAETPPSLDMLVAAARGIAPRIGPAFRVRAHRIGERSEAPSPAAIEREVGAALAPGRRVVFDGPADELRVLLAERAHLALAREEIDRRPFEARHVRHRPHFRPVALHPRFARALVNLARVRPGDRVADPFAGTGGLLVEAALVGAKVVGGDLDPGMAEGARAFLRQEGLAGDVLQGDVAETLAKGGPFDAVMSDPPYGRASWTAKEKPRDLCRRALSAIAEHLKPGGRAALVFPFADAAALAPPSLALEQAHVQRVHRSLERHYFVFVKRA
jgi:tRNA (guanine10-N2)-dimethyltransferase